MLPEEIELERLESEHSELEENIINAELELETLKVELSQFQYRYYQGPGRLYAELDELDAKIAMAEAGLHPDDIDAEYRAKEAEQKAKQSAEEAGIVESTPPPVDITPETKQAFRKAAKLMHPDRATSEEERIRRNVIMAEVNVAYEKGDIKTIEKLIAEFGQDPEAIVGDDIGSRMVKAIRRIAQIKRRFTEIEEELFEAKKHELFELMTYVKDTEAMGGNPLLELEKDILQQISEKKIQFETIRQQLNIEL
jgi:hypothetical protein